MDFHFLKHAHYDQNTPGLSTKEAEKRLGEFGENTIEMSGGIHPLRIFLAQFKDVFVVILLISMALSFFMGETVEAVAIIAIVCLNAALGFFQEYKTEKTLDALKSLAAPLCTVIRDGKQMQQKAALLVPGDVVVLQAGDRVPADCVLVTSNGIQCDESLLTGESVPVSKEESRKSDHRNMDEKSIVYMGTLLTKGRGKAVCFKTGMETQMGQIAYMLDRIEEAPTPLQKRLGQLAQYIAIACVFICVAVAALGYLRGENLFDMIVVGISLAVAAVPEGLPAVVTISLALAVSRMLKKQAIIRKLHAVETLGCASVICSDKTGTLTQNKMTVKEITTWEKAYTFTGEGYENTGAFFCQKEKTSPEKEPALEKLLTIGALCNNASIFSKLHGGEKKGAHFQWETVGDPTEVALMVAAAKGDIHRESLDETYTIQKENPFDSTRKAMSVLVQNKGGEHTLFVKGAADVLLEKSKWIYTAQGAKPLSGQVKAQLLTQNEEMAKKALRVLGFAYRPAQNAQDMGEENLIFVGMCGMIDPPREQVKASVARCVRAGIFPVMITGDHKITATAIAKQVGIYHQGQGILTGKELDDMPEDVLKTKVRTTSVYARVKPEHKLRIVKALKANGQVVAMTGDGVNDAPAIKEADIGIAMGISGTDVTKEAASVILMDDDFSTIVDTVEEGRVIYQNIRKFIRYLLSCNIGEVVTMFLGMLMGMPIVLLPIQILMVNLVTDGLPAIALGLDPPEDDVMGKIPRRASESVFSKGLLSKIVFRGFVIGLSTLGVFVSLMKHTHSLELARTGAFFTLVLTQLIHVFECKSESKSILHIDIGNNKKLILAALFSFLLILFAVYTPVGNRVFSTAALKLGHLAVVCFYTLIGPIVSVLFMGSYQRRTSR